MDNSKVISLPQMPWYGDTELEISFPDSWDIVECRMQGHDSPPLSDDAMREAFSNPIGSKTIKELAQGKKEVVILFDDMSRATPTDVIIPYVLKELSAAGIPDDNIRFIAAIAAHGSMNGIDFRKKLGDDVMGRFLVYNHNPYENCTPLGVTTQGTPVSINSEVMSCDLKIGIGSIVPHIYTGFGGGSKIVLPGVASMETIDANHTRLSQSPTIGLGKYEGNVIKEDMDEVAEMVGLDMKIDAILNLKREITALFVGHTVQEHIKGMELARTHYATELVDDADLVVANCYSKANEMALAPMIAAPLLNKSGGEMVLIAITPEGQINHYWCRSFGKKFGGRAWTPRNGLPPDTERLTIMSPYSDRVGGDWVAPYDKIHWAKSWDEVRQGLQERHGQKTRVAVIPDATVQYFPES